MKCFTNKFQVLLATGLNYTALRYAFLNKFNTENFIHNSNCHFNYCRKKGKRSQDKDGATSGDEDPYDFDSAGDTEEDGEFWELSPIY